MAHSPKIIQTLYIHNSCSDPANNSQGFLSPEFNWFSWALSCLQLKQYYDNVQLYTNDLGYNILINRLKLPYDKVNVVLNPLRLPSQLWAFSKLYSYGMQSEPFIHIDGDVFFWEKIDSELFNEPLVAQNVEVNKSYYRTLVQHLLSENIFLPNIIVKRLKTHGELAAYNAGIIGGTDTDFFRNYAMEAFKLLEVNNFKFGRNDLWQFNTVCEQVLFYCLASEKRESVTCYLKDEINDMTYPGLGDFLEVPYKTKFIHLMGAFKQNANCCFMLAKRLREYYPKYYYRIIDECLKSSINLFIKYYDTRQNGKESENDFYIDQINKDSGKRKTKWKTLYKKENSQLKKALLAFSNIEILLQVKFRINPYLIETKSSINGNDFLFTYNVPFSYSCSFNKIEGDELDKLLIKLLKSPRKFNDLILMLMKYFGNNEIPEEADLLRKLVTLRLRRGCDNNVFDVIMPKEIHKSR